MLIPVLSNQTVAFVTSFARQLSRFVSFKVGWEGAGIVVCYVLLIGREMKVRLSSVPFERFISSSGLISANDDPLICFEVLL